VIFLLGEVNVLLVDNKSKHYKEIIDHLRKKKAIIIRVDPLKCDIKKINFDVIAGAVLTGGNDVQVQKKRKFNYNVIRFMKNKPILGICYGHEFLLEYYNGHLYKMNYRAQGLSHVDVVKSNPLIGKGRILVYKGHSFAGGIIPDSFEKLAHSSDCEYEMVQHKKYPHFGVQFHPEMTQHGNVIFENFLKLCRKSRF
jgi:GMP synthase (glutamine-hydrolysing)